MKGKCKECGKIKQCGEKTLTCLECLDWIINNLRK